MYMKQTVIGHQRLRMKILKLLEATDLLELPSRVQFDSSDCVETYE